MLKFDGLSAILECLLIQVVLSLMSCQWLSCATPIFVKKCSSQSSLVGSNEVYMQWYGILHSTHQIEPFERRSRCHETSEIDDPQFHLGVLSQHSGSKD